MRSIKFRAWDRVEKKMIANALMVRNIGLGDGSLLVDADAQKGNELDWLQFTGLKDKNGVQIYEGDIIKWGHVRSLSRENFIRIVEVKFNPDIQFHSQVGIFNFGRFAYADSTDKDLEIINNIYVNPELIPIKIK